MITWSEIEAEAGDYRDGFVAVFHKYEGMETDEKDGQGRTVKVTQSSFARHFGIAEATFHDWVKRPVDGRSPQEKAQRAKIRAKSAVRNESEQVAAAIAELPEAERKAIIKQAVAQIPDDERDDIVHEIWSDEMKERMKRYGRVEVERAAQPGFHPLDELISSVTRLANDARVILKTWSGRKRNWDVDRRELYLREVNELQALRHLAQTEEGMDAELAAILEGGES